MKERRGLRDIHRYPIDQQSNMTKRPNFSQSRIASWRYTKQAKIYQREIRALIRKSKKLPHLTSSKLKIKTRRLKELKNRWLDHSKMFLIKNLKQLGKEK